MLHGRSTTPPLTRCSCSHGTTTGFWVEITAATLDDIQPILQIEADSQPEPWSRSLFEGELMRAQSQLLVARMAGRSNDPLGYICFWEVAGEIQILNIAVHRAYRRQGIGRALLLQALHYGVTKQASVAVLEVRCTNESAIRLYESLGFRAVGERTGYYKSRETAIIMELELKPDDIDC